MRLIHVPDCRIFLASSLPKVGVFLHDVNHLLNGAVPSLLLSFRKKVALCM